MSNTFNHNPDLHEQDAPKLDDLGLDDLARRYLDLWQDQWSALAADPGVADMVARSFGMMGPAAAGFAGFANMLAAQPNMTQNTPFTPNAPFTMWGGNARSHGNHSPPSPRATTAATSSQRRPDDMAELRDRLASMEQRIADLASQLAQSSNRTDRDDKKG